MRKVYLLFLALCFLHGLNAQEIDSVEVTRNEDGVISDVKLDDRENARPDMKQAVAFLKRLHNAPTDVDFRLVKKNDQAEFAHQRFQQFYKGIKVEGSQYIVHSKDGLIESSNGGYAPLDGMSVTPSVSEKSAVQLAISNFPSKQFEWRSESDSLYPKGSLVIAQSGETRKWSLAWKILLVTTEPLRAEYVFVDAKSGNIIKRQPAMCYTNAPGTAATRYSGSRAITGDSFNGAFRLKETVSGTDLMTMNYNHSGSPSVTSVATEFIDNNNNWTDAEYHNANMDDGALDAHWGLERTEEYFRVMQGRNGLDGNNHKLTAFVHYGTSLNNAFWYEPTESFYFGDGTGNPFTSLDVVAHEIGHGINFFEGGLDYDGEGGALNEGLSDIWGAVVEWYANAQKDIWTIGESVLGLAQRSMSDPKSKNCPDTYQGQYWVVVQNCAQAPDNCGVHTNLRVIDYWFFLLSQGGTGTNDLGNSYNVPGIGIEKAANIVYYAERNYFTPTSVYTNARSHMISAATALYGANSCEVRSVTDAWYAVGVGTAFPIASLNLQMTGPSAFCSGSQVYTVPNETVSTWTLNPASGPATLTGTGSNSRTLTKNYDYMVTITANVNNACDITGFNATSVKTVKLGLPPLTGASVNGQSSVPPQSPVQYSVTLPSWATGTKQWILPTGWTIISGQGTNQAVFQTGTSGGAITFRLTSCGTSRDVFKTVTICSGRSGTSLLDTSSDVFINNASRIFVHPNPANNIVTLSVDGISTLQEYKVIDEAGRIVKGEVLSKGAKSKNIDVSQFHVGLYFISINNGKEWIIKKLIIRR